VLYAVSLAQTGGGVLDPGGRFAETLLPSTDRPPRRDDLEDVVRARVLLGGMFAREGRIGPADRQNTAIWQWQWVLDAEQAERRRHPDLPASPEAYLQLGSAYEQVGDGTRAEVAYRAARDAFAESHDDAGAGRAGDKLRRCRPCTASSPAS
jgi:hypothetical protein